METPEEYSGYHEKALKQVRWLRQDREMALNEIQKRIALNAIKVPATEEAIATLERLRTELVAKHQQRLQRLVHTSKKTGEPDGPTLD